MGIKDYPVNKFGVVQFPKGDIRRWFVLLAAIDHLKHPTLTSLADFTGWNKGSIQRDLPKVEEQLGIVIEKSGAVYKILSWGNLVSQKGIKNIILPST